MTRRMFLLATIRTNVINDSLLALPTTAAKTRAQRPAVSLVGFPVTSLAGSVTIVRLVTTGTALQFPVTSTRRANSVGNDQYDVHVSINHIVCKSACAVYEQMLRMLRNACRTFNPALHIPACAASRSFESKLFPRKPTQAHDLHACINWLRIEQCKKRINRFRAYTCNGRRTLHAGMNTNRRTPSP